MKIIRTTCGAEVKVSDQDFEKLSRHRWFLARGGGKSAQPYATASIERKLVRMHRLILGARPGEIVDHVNRDSLDNRRENLRIVTRGQNRVNSKDNEKKSDLPRNIWKMGNLYVVEVKRNRKRVRPIKKFSMLADAVAFRDELLRSLP